MKDSCNTSDPLQFRRSSTPLQVGAVGSSTNLVKILRKGWMNHESWQQQQFGPTTLLPVPLTPPKRLSKRSLFYIFVLLSHVVSTIYKAQCHSIYIPFTLTSFITNKFPSNDDAERPTTTTCSCPAHELQRINNSQRLCCTVRFMHIDLGYRSKDFSFHLSGYLEGRGLGRALWVVQRGSQLHWTLGLITIFSNSSSKNWLPTLWGYLNAPRRE